MNNWSAVMVKASGSRSGVGIRTAQQPQPMEISDYLNRQQSSNGNRQWAIIVQFIKLL